MTSNLSLQKSSWLDRPVYLQRVGLIVMIANIVSIILGVLYLLVPRPGGLWNIYGALYLFTLLATLILVYLQDQKRDFPLTLGKINSFYLGFTIFAMLGMMVGTFWLSNSYNIALKATWFPRLLIYFSYFGLLIVGGFLGWDVSQTQQQELIRAETPQSSKARLGWGRILLQIICYVIMLWGLFFSEIITINWGHGLIETGVAEFSLYYAFIYLSALMILLHYRKRSTRTIYYAHLIVGLLIVCIAFLPVITVPKMKNEAEQNFTQAFGKEWRSQIPKEVANTFRSTPFLIPDYFLGISTPEYVVKKDILFYEGKDKKDQGIKLFYDVYQPGQETINQQKPRATIVRIHGGAWIAGDKGLGNMMQMNKYLAAQGYVVFDIQYGLAADADFNMNLSTPEHVQGQFDIDDMVRHIGIFVQYMTEHQRDYNLDLDRVFISGGSAGGHLTTAVALAIHSGEYQNLFGSEVTVRGYIPFYPGNGLAPLGGIGGTPELVNPELLVKPNLPPCLIFQGTKDTLVPPIISQEFKNLYDVTENQCAVLWMPFGGHAADIKFAGYYNQIFLYYMERFIYLFK